jgi:hypothetical protein
MPKLINFRLIGLIRNWRVHIAAVIQEYVIPMDGDALPVPVVLRLLSSRSSVVKRPRLFRVGDGTLNRRRWTLT